MVVVQGIDALVPALGRLFVVVGVFDGLHLGHQYLLRELRDAATRHGARPAVITFDHHPDAVLTGSAPPLLCDPDERLALLDAEGVAVTVVQHFDVALRETPFEAFVGRIAASVSLAGFLMTPDSAFGFERRGTPATVATLGRELGFEVEVVPPFTLDGAAVSSSDIRRAIASGDLAAAGRLLGRAVAVTGRAEQTTSDGTALGFELPVTLPPPGRYPVQVGEPGGPATASELAIATDGGATVIGRIGQGARVRVTFA